MVFADAERIQTDPISVNDLFDEIAKTVRGADLQTRIVVGRGEAINANLHRCHLRRVRYRPSNYPRERGHVLEGKSKFRAASQCTLAPCVMRASEQSCVFETDRG